MKPIINLQFAIYILLTLNIANVQGQVNSSLVGHWGYGPCWAVTPLANYTYMGSGCVFMIMNNSNPASLQKVGELLLPNVVEAIKIMGNYAYVADNEAGLRIINISNPAQPIATGSVNTNNYAIDVAVSGNYAYVANLASGLKVINISNPANPQVVGSWSATGAVRGVDAAGNYVYVTDDQYGLRILNVSNPASPILVGSCPTPGSALDVVLNGNLAFVADNSGTRIINISNPASPSLIGSIPVVNQVCEVAVAGNYLYVPETNTGLKIYNISNPANPQQLSLFNYTDAMYISINNNFAWVSAFGYGMKIINVANPANPVLAGIFRTPGWSIGIALHDQYAYLSAGNAGMQILDISNPASPVKVGFDSTQFGILQKHGNYLYAVNGSNGIRIMDITNPLQPAQIGLITTPGSAVNVRIKDNYAYVAAGTNGLRIVDITNLSAPVEVAFYDTPGYVADLVLQGNKAYLHDAWEGLKILDISTPLQPTLMGSLSISGQGGGIDITGNYVYFANTYQGVRVIDVSNPAAPFEVSYYNTWAQRAVIAGIYAYTSQSTYGLGILNISNPSSPSFLGYYPTPGQTETSVLYRNAFLFVPDEFAGMEILAVPPVISITGLDSACANIPGYVYLTEQGNSNYTWNISSGGTINSGNGTSSISVTWNTLGPQTVSVNYMTPYNFTAPVPTVFNVTVVESPLPAISGPDSACANPTLVNYQTEAGMTGYDWQVSSGGAIISGSGTNSVMVLWSVPGAQTIGVNYIGPAGCMANTPTIKNVYVSPLPGPADSITGTPTLCAGETGIPYFTDPVADATFYVWNLPVGATIATGYGTESITVDFSETSTSGEITVVPYNQCGGGTTSPAYNVIVNPIPPTPVITISGDTLFSSSPTGNQWYFEGTAIPGATQQTLVATQDGAYWTEVTLNGCISDSSNHIYVSLTAMNNEQVSDIRIYPVPNDGRFVLSAGNAWKINFNLKIYNLQGRIVFQLENLDFVHQKDVAIDLRPVANGIYQMVLLSDRWSISKTILISE